MGFPKINISFKEVSTSAIQRGRRGIVALILKDVVPAINPVEIRTSSEVPSNLSLFNQNQIRLAMLGYATQPRKVIAFVIPEAAEDYSTAQNYLEGVKWDYVAVPSIAELETSAFASWIKGLRDTKEKKVKAVLPNTQADHEGIINVTAEDMKEGDTAYTPAEYCSRVAGLIAGTPLTISCTFAPVTELSDCKKYTIDELEQAIDNGEFTLYHDGEKVKVARAVNSLVTTTEEKGESFRKIKVVDTIDMIHDDIKRTVEDNYIGKYANSYDNKCLLISAIQDYFDQLELNGLLERGTSLVSIDIAAQTGYLKSIGVDIEGMSDQDIKQANTKDKIFLAANIRILDTIEEIALNIAL